MTIDLTAPQVAGWIEQFKEAEDRVAAADLLSVIRTVSADELTRGLTSVIESFAAANPGPIALYGEREIRRQHGSPDRLFKETRTKIKRAFGDGPTPVPAGKPAARRTGSEGVIATLISGLCGARPDTFFDHPGPKQIRDHSLRHYLVVTDFIGSGSRACDNLQAAWQIKSFKSWRSYGLMDFAVAAFSGTTQGIEKVEKHSSRPAVCFFTGCPTLQDLPVTLRERLVAFCYRCAPTRTRPSHTPLGYDDGGVLISFDHGIPNNAPLLLHSKAGGRLPLFPKRSAALLRGARKETERHAEIVASLKKLHEKRLAVGDRFDAITEDQKNRILVLVALKRRPRKIAAISAKVNLPVFKVEIIIERARADGLIDANLRPTPAAFKQFAYLRSTDQPKGKIPRTDESYYCPAALRPPRGVV